MPCDEGRRPNSVVSAVLAGILLFSGCTSTEAVLPRPGPTGSALPPSSAPQGVDEVRGVTGAQQRELAERLGALRDAPAWTVHSSLSRGDTRQDADYRVEPARSAFWGDITVDVGGDRQAMTILRAQRLTWVRAPAAYWKQNGYDDESAAAADGLFVPFEAVAGDQLAENYDPSLLLTHLSEVELGRVTDAGADGFDFGDGLFVVVPPDGGIIARTAVGTGVLEVTYVPSTEPLRLEAPAREETYTAR